jgi:hypothetical protein
MPRNPEDTTHFGRWLYRFYHYPRRQLASRNPDFWLYLLLRRVRGGPFAGMRYVGESPNLRIGPALLGTMETEIQPFVRRLLAQDFDVFVNAGAAEGYYTVGFARFGRAGRVIAFEGAAAGRALIRLMARRNGVAAKVDVRGFCTAETLAAALAGSRHPGLLLDIEGHEAEALDPAKVPQLRQAAVIVELHEWEKPVADILRPRFVDTHMIEEVWTRPLMPADLPANLAPATWFFSRAKLLQLADEHRGRDMRWWLLTPKLAEPPQSVP